VSYWPLLFFLKLAIQPCLTRVREYGQQKVSVLLINVSCVSCVFRFLQSSTYLIIKWHLYYWQWQIIKWHYICLHCDQSFHKLDFEAKINNTLSSDHMDDIYVCHAGEWVKRFPLSQITSKSISKLIVGCCLECLITYFHQIIFLRSWNVWNWQLNNKRIEMRKIRHYYVLSTQHMSLHSFPTHPQAFTVLKQDVNIPCIYVTSQPLGNVTWYEIILTIFN
jgi:hypothetical protein